MLTSRAANLLVVLLILAALAAFLGFLIGVLWEPLIVPTFQAIKNALVEMMP